MIGTFFKSVARRETLYVSSLVLFYMELRGEDGTYIQIVS